MIRIDPGFRMGIGRVIGEKLSFHAGKGRRTVFIRIFIRSRRAVFISIFIRKNVNTEGVCQGFLCKGRVIAVVDGRGCSCLPGKAESLCTLLSLSGLVLRDAFSD